MPLPYDKVKRLFDVLSAGFLLVITLPLQVLIGACIAATLGTPVLFRQQRPGLNGEVFWLIKFRSMRPEGCGTDAERLTRFGRALRALSLDELPTLWNVLKGDMSMIGPRPLLVEYLPLYTAEQARRHEVRPGMSGLAQIHGRNELSWEQKFAFDVDYVDRVSFALDLRIVFSTIKTVLSRRGISASGAATAHKFQGTPVTSRENPQQHDKGSAS